MAMIMIVIMISYNSDYSADKNTDNHNVNNSGNINVDTDGNTDCKKKRRTTTPDNINADKNDGKPNIINDNKMVVKLVIERL